MDGWTDGWLASLFLQSFLSTDKFSNAPKTEEVLAALAPLLPSHTHEATCSASLPTELLRWNLVSLLRCLFLSHLRRNVPYQSVESSRSEEERVCLGYLVGIKSIKFVLFSWRRRGVWFKPSGWNLACPRAAKDASVDTTDYRQLMIAACSYLLKHNGAGAVIISALEWLINF